MSDNKKINKERKYRCKESIYGFIINKYYEINEIYTYMIEMRIIVNYQYNYYCFSLEDDYDSLPNFNRFFYSEKEERKVKLKQIEESQKITKNNNILLEA
jgi:hypothetical protein